MKNNLNNQEEEFKYNGIYRAIVVANEDPRDIGRIKVHVPGVYPDNMEIGLYPWAQPAVSPYNSGGENKTNGPEVGKNLEKETFGESYNSLGTGGIFTVPSKGNTVFVWFDQGNHMYPYYFAMEPKEGDWLAQKVNLKDKINTKIADISDFVAKFKPEQGVKGEPGTDWADGAYINARQKVSSKGETLGGGQASESLGSERIKGGGYKPTKVNHTNEDTDGKDSLNMKTVTERARSNLPSLDIKPLLDKEDGAFERKIVKDQTEIKYDENPHVYSQTWNVDDTLENERNINRYVTSIMTEGGTSIIIDHREGQENFYLIHKGYMKNIDQHGSVKEYIGTTKVDEGEPERCDKELGVEGDNKIHVLGNFVTYVKGNKFTQVDKNLQIDVNDSCGIRMKKGDFDIVLNGLTQSDRDDNKDSDREDAKEQQFGDLNIDIQNGNMDVHVSNNCNIHVEGNANLKVDKSFNMEVGENYSLKVVGETNMSFGGNVNTTIDKNNSLTVNGKTDIKTGGLFIDSTMDVSKEVKLGAGLHVKSGIDVGADVKSKAGVSLLQHKHPFQWWWSHGGGSSGNITKTPFDKAGSPQAPTTASPTNAKPKEPKREHDDRGEPAPPSS